MAAPLSRGALRAYSLVCGKRLPDDEGVGVRSVLQHPDHDRGITWRVLPAVISVVAGVAAGVAGTGSNAQAASAQSAQSVPAAPLQLTVPTLSPDQDSISLNWAKPASHGDIADYHVYRNGTLIGSANDTAGGQAGPLVTRFYADASNAEQYRVVPHHFIAAGLKPDTSYTFTVRSVNRAGVESADSTPVTASTTAVPRVFDVTDYGAVGDGTTLNTKAIQAAIAAATPGATVRIPAGTFKTGAIWLKSDLTLDVAKGATLLGSENADDYQWGFRLLRYSTDVRFHALINAQTYTPGALRNIRIVGQGTIDGNGWLQQGVDADGFRVAMPSTSATVGTNGVLAKAQVARASELGSKAPYPTRSNLIDLRGVTNAYYGGFTATNPANHTLVNINTKNVTVEGVRLETYSNNSSASGNNADGVEFINSTGLKVYDCVFDMGDDAVNLNAGIGAEAAADQPTSNVWVFDNYFRNSHGAIVAGSFTGAWIQDVLAEDNVITIGDVALRMKTAPANGGGGRRFLFRDSAVKNVAVQAFVFTSAYSDPNAAITVEPAPVKARFEDVTVQNVTVDGTGGPAIGVIGVFDQYHQKLRFDSVRFIHALPTSITYLKASSFKNVTFDHTPNPWVITHSTSLRFSGNTVSTPATVDASTAPVWSRISLFSATPASTSATLNWTAATDDTAVSAYSLLVNDKVVATVPGNRLDYTVTGLSPALRYTFAVRAQDATGNETTGRSVSAVTTGSPDAVPPVAPTDPAAVSAPAAGIGITWAKVAWLAATDDVALKGYDVYLNGRKVATPSAPATTATLTGLKPSTDYVLTVRAVDGSGNTAAYPAPATFTTLPVVVLDPLPY
jgi:exo-poly-alpha-galacturonosidase